MLDKLIYVFMFAFATMVIYGWGILKSRNKQRDLLNALYSKGNSIILKEIKKNGYITKNEAENALKDVEASLFYSKNRVKVMDTKIFTKELLQVMLKENIIEEETPNSKKYILSKNKE